MKMLINPTDLELNYAFAEHVAGWMQCERLGKLVWYDPEGGHEINLPRFTESADLVLPCLDKWRDRPFLYRLAQIDMTAEEWWVKLAQPGHVVLGQDFWHGRSDTLPRACVIALLRANGVEVEFTP